MVFIVFAIGMIYLVYRCIHVNTDLVTKEYYKDELKYQDVIDGTRMANALSGRVQLNQDNEAITIQLPGEMKNERVSGKIWFYCAADAKKDRHISLAMDADAMQQISKKVLQPGSYTVKLNWKSNNKNYYTEQTFTIL